MEKAKRGNERAFEKLVRLYEARVFYCAISLVGNRQDAEEVTQDAFVKVWKTLSQFRGECSFSSWLMRITRNTATDRLRARREKTLSLYSEGADGVPYELSLIDEDPAHNPPRAYERDEKIAAVRRAIAALQPDQREILILRDLNGHTYAQLSEILGLEDGTVRSRLNRARLHLKEILESWNFSP